MTDLPDGSGQIRRTPRVSESGAPVSGALAIVLAVIAVLAGFVILRSISNGGDQELGAIAGEAPGADSGSDSAGDVTDPGSSTTTPSTVAPTTVPPIQTEGAQVIVANANGRGGSAAAMTRELESGPNFVMVDPVDANASIPDQDDSVIYFDTTNSAAQGVANSLAEVLGGVDQVVPLPPDTPLTADGSLNGATVLLMLGNDFANRTLAEINPSGVTGGVSVVTNPPVTPETTG